MLIAFFVVGVALCLLVGYAVVTRYRLPWRQALIYFGLAPYPGEDRTRTRIR